MSILDRKLGRDFMRLWAQILAVALVMACGVAVLILAMGAYRSLDETRAAFYDRYGFATVFASATRAPKSLESRIRALPGVAAVELRIARQVLLDVEGMAEPAAAIAVSLPEDREAKVNRLYLREGRLPEPGRDNEVAVIRTFAAAHGFRPGDSFGALMNGRKREMRIVGIVYSPEYIYTIGPGDMMPDPRRFGVFFMPEKTLAAIFDMRGAFNDAVLTTLRDADLRTIKEGLDELLDRYGGTGAYLRKDQISHAFLDNELIQLNAMARVIPPIFLVISAFLVGMVLSRLIALEREQIGVLKAMGFSALAVSWHYLKLVLAISVVGIAIGIAAGTWLGQQMTELYGEFFSFPFLLFHNSFDLYVIAAAVSAGAALLGAVRAILSVASLPPAVAMRAPTPTRYFGGLSHLQSIRIFSNLTMMAVRHLLRFWGRSLLTAIGVSLSVALLVTALFTTDSIDSMIDIVFFQMEREDATITFQGDKGPEAVRRVADMDGVLRAEAFRVADATLRRGHREKRISIRALEESAELSRILDVHRVAMSAPPNGIVLSERLCDLLGVSVGDHVEIELRQSTRAPVDVVVSAQAESLIGLTAYMSRDALDRLIMDGRRVSGAHVVFDENRLGGLYEQIKQTPGIASIALLGVSRQRFEETIEENIRISNVIYVTLAVIITFGVVYNSARIQLSERARELASLRVLGFTRAEVASVLLIELGAIVALAQPIGWLGGYGFALAVTKGFESDLFRIPFVINSSTFAMSSLIVIAASAVSGVLVVRRVRQLDLIRTLKTRE